MSNKPAKPKLVETTQEDNHFGVAIKRRIYEVQIRALVKVRGEDAYRDATPAEQQFWGRKAVEVARRHDAKKRQRVVDKLKQDAFASDCDLR
jgi:predicted NAD-dependent protein-ADP-ribosyltransferase YbiA (DUF1768 family)